jgi:hypothetical protein
MAGEKCSKHTEQLGSEGCGQGVDGNFKASYAYVTSAWENLLKCNTTVLLSFSMSLTISITSYK